MSDVRLDRGFVGVEGQLRVEGPDIHVDEPSRRHSENNRPYRRALVHGFQDELVVNYSSDYRGVTINAREGDAIRLNGQTLVGNIDVSQTLLFLLEERQRLLRAVNALERKSRLPLTPAMGLDLDVDVNPGIDLGPIISPNIRI